MMLQKIWGLGLLVLRPLLEKYNNPDTKPIIHK